MDVISQILHSLLVNCIYFIIFIINRYVLYNTYIHMYEHIYIDMDAHTCIEIYINLLDSAHTYSKRIIEIMSVHIV